VLCHFKVRRIKFRIYRCHPVFIMISCQVESELKTCPVVENCCVYGDPSQSYVVALIVPDRVRLEQLAENLGISVSIIMKK
jgi:hypothetical protein